MKEQPRYVLIREMDIANGEGIGCAVYFQGCPYHCFNCFNPETWDMSQEAGLPFTEKEEKRIYEIVANQHIKRITFLGGEPLIERNLDILNKMLDEIKSFRPDMHIWFFSGNTFEKLIQNKKIEKILRKSDVLVDGPFVDEKKNFRLRFRGSENQRIIDLQKSFNDGAVFLREDLMLCR